MREREIDVWMNRLHLMDEPGLGATIHLIGARGKNRYGSSLWSIKSGASLLPPPLSSSSRQRERGESSTSDRKKLFHSSQFRDSLSVSLFSSVLVVVVVVAGSSCVRMRRKEWGLISIFQQRAAFIQRAREGNPHDEYSIYIGALRFENPFFAAPITRVCRARHSRDKVEKSKSKRERNTLAWKYIDDSSFFPLAPRQDSESLRIYITRAKEENEREYKHILPGGHVCVCVDLRCVPRDAR